LTYEQQNMSLTGLIPRHLVLKNVLTGLRKLPGKNFSMKIDAKSFQARKWLAR
jgi:hypothetical protein